VIRTPSTPRLLPAWATALFASTHGEMVPMNMLRLKGRSRENKRTTWFVCWLPWLLGTCCRCRVGWSELTKSYPELQEIRNGRYARRVNNNR
jgi:hypothetical protein